MRPSLAVRLAVLLGLLAACGTGDGPTAPPITPQFGRVVATIDGVAFTSSYFPDSTIAFYNPGTGALQVSGQRVQPGPWPTLRITLPAVVGPGSFALAGNPQVILGEWLPSLTAGYLSVGAPTDSVWIDELDLPTRELTGRFRFTATDLFHPRSVLVQGDFQGHMILQP